MVIRPTMMMVYGDEQALLMRQTLYEDDQGSDDKLNG